VYLRGRLLSGDVIREATSDEVKALRSETAALKETLGEMVLENRLLKKSVLGDGEVSPPM
jgi:transposase